MPSEETRISVEGLEVWFGKRHVLKNVNASIPDRRITAVIGPSGCGKTTFLRCLNRLTELTEGARIKGRILLDGSDIMDQRTDVTMVRKRVGLLAQKPFPLPMSIFENVAYGPRVHGEGSEDRLDRIVSGTLRSVGLWEEVKDRLDDPANSLSIGQQQRLCLARGLAVEPEVILCDEPTSALDPVSAKTVERVLLGLKERYAIVLVTHTLRQARRMADHVMFMYGGRIEEQGRAEILFERPRMSHTRAFIEGEIG